MKKKGEASDIIVQFIPWFERKSEVQVKSLHTDGGKEFKKARVEMQGMGVNTSTTNPYSSASNGLVERTQGVLLPAIGASFYQSQHSHRYWNEALQYAVQCKMW